MTLSTVLWIWLAGVVFAAFVFFILAHGKGPRK